MERVFFFVLRRKSLLNAALLLFAVGLLVGLRYPAKEVLNTSSAVSGKTVTIDPGHGGPDPGAVSASGIREKEIVLAIAEKLEPLLNRAAIYTHLTRRADEDLGGQGARSFSSRKRQDLSYRVEVAHRTASDIFVSIHANSFPESIWYGAQTFYYPGEEESKYLAQAIQAELVARLGPNKRQPRPGQYWVLEKTSMPAVVVEVGFLSNPREAALLATPEYQDRAAEAIFYGIVRYFTERERREARQREHPGDQQQKTSEPATKLTELEPGEVALYFKDPNSDGLAVERRVLPGPGRGAVECSHAALLALIDGPSPASGLHPVIPAGTRVLHYELQGDTACVDLSQEMRDNFTGGGVLEEVAIYAIVNTLTSFPEIKAVRVSIAGETGATLGGHLLLDKPFSYNRDAVTCGP